MRTGNMQTLVRIHRLITGGMTPTTITTDFELWFAAEARKQKRRERAAEAIIGGLTALLVGSIAFATFQNAASLLAGGATGILASAVLALTFHEKMLSRIRGR